jgi:integrase/recombinase XerD
MRISEVPALDRAALEWELRQAVIIGKGRKERTVYFSEEAIDWLTKYLSTRHDDYPAVFVTTGSPPKRLRAHGTWKRFNRYGQMAGLAKRVYPHLLRHRWRQRFWRTAVRSATFGYSSGICTLQRRAATT